MEEKLQSTPRIFNVGLIIITAVMWADFTGTITTLSMIKESLDVDILGGPRIVYVFFLSIAIFLPVTHLCARLVDYKVLLKIGALTYGISSIAFGEWSNFYFNLLCRFVQGAGVGTLLYCVFNLLAISRPFPSRTYQLYSLVGFVFGPFLVLLCTYFLSWSFFYDLLGIIALIAATFVIYNSPKVKVTLSNSESLVPVTFTFIITFSSLMILMNLLMDHSSGAISKFVAIIIFFSSLFLFFKLEKNRVKGLFFSKDLIKTEPLLLYKIGFFSGFISIPMFIMQNNYLHLLYVHHSRVSTLFILLSAITLSIFSVVGYQLCRRISRLRTLVISLLILCISFALSTQLLLTSSQWFIGFNIVLSSIGIGLIFSSGLGNRVEGYKKNIAIKLAMNYLIIFSTGVCIGSNLLSHINVKYFFKEMFYRIDEDLLILPQQVIEHVEFIPYLVNYYDTHAKLDNLMFSKVSWPVMTRLNEIYREAFMEALHAFSALSCLTTIIVLFFVYRKFYQQKD